MHSEKFAKDYKDGLKQRANNLFPSRFFYPDDNLVAIGSMLCRSFNLLPGFASDIYGEFMTIRALRTVLPEPSKFIDMMPESVQDFFGKNDSYDLIARENLWTEEINYTVGNPKFTDNSESRCYWDKWLKSVIQAGRGKGIELGLALNNVNPEAFALEIGINLIPLQRSIPPATLAQVEILRRLVYGRDYKSFMDKIVNV